MKYNSSGKRPNIILNVFYMYIPQLLYKTTYSKLIYLAIKIEFYIFSREQIVIKIE